MTIVLNRLWIAVCASVAAILAFAPVFPVSARSEADLQASVKTVAVVEAEAEATSRIAFNGQLIELSSTDLPTTIVVRKDPEGEFTDYTIEIGADATLVPSAMADWITGDTLNVQGTLNENTGLVTAARVQNLSVNPFQHAGLNGWVEAIDTNASTMTVKWENRSVVVKVTAATKMVVPPKNPAALSDFKVGDRVRGRLVKGSATNEARIIVALRRGDDIFLKARTRPFAGTLKAIDDAGKSITVELAADKRLKADDVNNLVGVAGELVTVTLDENTKIVRRFNGSSTLEEFTEGDKLFIVGRVGDDGVITARMIRNDSIFKRAVARQLAKITAIDTENNKLTVQVAHKADLRTAKVEAQGNLDDEHDALRAELKERMLEKIRLEKRLERGETWTIMYSSQTKIMKDGAVATEAELEVGDLVRVEGVANATNKTVEASVIHASSPEFRPLKRERPIKEIVKERIKTSLGKSKAQHILDNQKPAEAQEAEVEVKE